MVGFALKVLQNFGWIAAIYSATVGVGSFHDNCNNGGSLETSEITFQNNCFCLLLSGRVSADQSLVVSSKSANGR